MILILLADSNRLSRQCIQANPIFFPFQTISQQQSLPECSADTIKATNATDHFKDVEGTAKPRLINYKES